MTAFTDHLTARAEEIRSAGLYKSERIIASKQAGTIALESGREVINLCANAGHADPCVDGKSEIDRRRALRDGPPPRGRR